MAVKTRVEKQLIAKHQGELIGIQKKNQETVRRAKQVLDEMGRS